MATLTETAYYSRKIIKYGSIALVSLLIIRSTVISFKAYWKKAHPAPPPVPTVAFGKLPKLQFPERPNLPPITLKLETISGSLPKLSDQAKVFFMPQASPNLVAWENTRVWANRLGFSKNPEATDKFNYRFTTDTFPKTTLDVNVLTRNFSLVYDWRNDLGILSEGNPPQEGQAIAVACNYLRGIDVLTDDILDCQGESIFLKYNNGDLIKTLYNSEANFAKINFFRKNIDGIRVLPPNPKDANISVLLSPSVYSNRGIIEVKFTHYQVSYEKFATYPLKDSESAWAQLAAGKGFVANFGNNPDGKVTIRNAYLAYYDYDLPQNFLQPIIVFEGDGDFYAYVPAVSDLWLEQETATQNSQKPNQ